MRVPPLAVVLGIVALTAAPFASAAAAGCAVFSPGIQLNAVTLVPGPFPSVLGAAASCGGGRTFNSATTPSCPIGNLGPVGLQGEYCGPYLGVPFGATVTCTAASPAGFTSLVVGLGRFGTGNIGQLVQLPDDTMAHDGPSVAGFHTTRITNNIPGVATVIAYPVAVQLSHMFISCV